MEEKTVHIPAISCGHCVMTIKHELNYFDGIVSIEGNEKSKTITVKWNTPLTWETIQKTLRDIGYPSEED
jgi:copper chaperone